MSDTFSETRIGIPSFSPGRVWTIAGGTVTQLIRLKTFYFLLAFALLIVALSNLNVTQATPVEQLSSIKKIAFGAIDNFAWLYAVVATALLLPRDLEDRTLYTILCKPVRRIEYLLGKLTGVLIVIAISLFVMVLLSMAMIGVKQNTLVSDQIAMARADQRIPHERVEEQIKLIVEQGVRPSLFVAAYASFLKASVVAGMAILISTFASSSLFTIITSIFFFLIGHAHGMVTDFWLNKAGGNMVVRLFAKLFKLFVPDYQLFSFSEGIVVGAEVVPRLVWSMSLLTGGYLFVYLLLSLMIFLYKEF